MKIPNYLIVFYSGSQLGVTLPPGDVSQCLGTFWVVTADGGAAPGICQTEVGVLLNTPQYTGCPRQLFKNNLALDSNRAKVETLSSTIFTQKTIFILCFEPILVEQEDL